MKRLMLSWFYCSYWVLKENSTPQDFFMGIQKEEQFLQNLEENFAQKMRLYN